jgi:ABC-2 type transport system ATP-binding protein
MTPIISAREVNKSFGQQAVSKNISLDLLPGEIYGLLGPNGAGKTTLIRMLATITQPDSGEIFFNGNPLHPDHSQRMGYMPEERGLYKKMSVADQLLFFAQLRGLNQAEAKAKVKYWLERLEMMDWAKKKIEEISKGLAQKVQFVSCIMHKPELLILDEPFSGFDPVNADLIKELILELQQEGCSILFSTHRMDNVEELCSKIGIIHRGEKVMDGSISEIKRGNFSGKYDVGFHESMENTAYPVIPIKSWITNDGRYMMRFQTSENFGPQQLMQWATTQSTPMVYFSEYIPSIHDIFVATVDQSNTPTHE